MKTLSSESDRALEQAIANLERKGRYYERLAEHMRKRISFLSSWRNLDKGKPRFSKVVKVFRHL